MIGRSVLNEELNDYGRAIVRTKRLIFLDKFFINQSKVTKAAVVHVTIADR